MNKNSTVLLRDIRNIKKAQVSMTTKNISSSKDLQKARSSEQINLKKLMNVKINICLRTKTKPSKTLMKS